MWTDLGALTRSAAMTMALALWPSVNVATAAEEGDQLYLIDGQTISLNQLADEFLTVSLGRDGRILKWPSNQARQVRIVFRTTRTHDRVRAAAFDDFFLHTSKELSRLTEGKWTLGLSDRRFVQEPYAEDDIRVAVGTFPMREEIRSGSNLSYCAGIMCLSSVGGYLNLRGYETVKPSDRAANADPMNQDKRVEWKERLNGRGMASLELQHLESGYVQATALATGSRELMHSVCVTLNSENVIWFQAEILECVVRTLGFAGSSEIFAQSALGVRLPERADVFLGDDGRATVEQYANTLPSSFTHFDQLMLRTLYDPRIAAGMSQEQLEVILPTILSEVASEFLFDGE